MNFFDLLYGNRGIGIDKDAPPKTGGALLLEIVQRDGWDVCKLSALCLLTCVPIVTIPAALAGFHTALLRILRDVPGDPWSDFRRGWKSSGKQACPVLLSFVLPAAALLFAARYYSALTGALSALSFVCMGLLLMAMLAAVYAFPMLVAVELRTKALITNSFLLALARPHHALAGLIAAAGMFFAAGLLPLALLPLWAIAALAVIGVVADWAAWPDIQAFIVQQ